MTCRRAALALALALAAAPALAPVPAGAQQATPILVVSRERVLQEAAAAEALNEAEAEMTAALQARVDAVKAELAAEEQELTRLRGTLPAEEFDRRVRSFDQRVRREREATQGRAAALQTAFREARQSLVEALLPILVSLSQERGARLVLDRDQILVAHPSIDVTEAAIARMDARVGVPPLPSLDALEPQERQDPQEPQELSGEGGEGGKTPAAPEPPAGGAEAPRE